MVGAEGRRQEGGELGATPWGCSTVGLHSAARVGAWTLFWYFRNLFVQLFLRENIRTTGSVCKMMSSFGVKLQQQEQQLHCTLY